MNKKNKVVITGVTSFTGVHFAVELSKQGFEVIGYSRNLAQLNVDQKARLRFLQKNSPTIKIVDSENIKKIGKIDGVCLHGANTANYRRAEFETHKSNMEFQEIADAIIKVTKPELIMYTSSYAEAELALGEKPNRSFGPYADFKTIAWNEINTKYANQIPIFRYVIPTPFGQLEGRRLVRYLLDSWGSNMMPEIQFPLYVRDYVPITLLREHYANIMQDSFEKGLQKVFKPSFYAETNLAFVSRYAQELRIRSKINSKFLYSADNNYLEPLIRINTEQLSQTLTNIEEKKVWDKIIEDSLRTMSM